MLIDHHLQNSILHKLAQSDEPVRFSNLKDARVENSLFAYHANKLIARGMIEKTGEGFTLTASGARWINSMDEDLKSVKSTPKPLLQLVVRHENKVLLSKRTGQLTALLNTYMFPGGLYKAGKGLDENLSNILTKLFGLNHYKPQLISLIDSISHYQDGYVHHSLSHIYVLDLHEHITPPSDGAFQFEWVDSRTIVPTNPQFAQSLFVPLLLQRIHDNSLLPRDDITVHYDR